MDQNVLSSVVQITQLSRQELVQQIYDGRLKPTAAEMDCMRNLCLGRASAAEGSVDLVKAKIVLLALNDPQTVDYTVAQCLGLVPVKDQFLGLSFCSDPAVICKLAPLLLVNKEYEPELKDEPELKAREGYMLPPDARSASFIMRSILVNSKAVPKSVRIWAEYSFINNSMPQRTMLTWYTENRAALESGRYDQLRESEAATANIYGASKEQWGIVTPESLPQAPAAVTVMNHFQTLVRVPTPGTWGETVSLQTMDWSDLRNAVSDGTVYPSIQVDLSGPWLAPYCFAFLVALIIAWAGHKMRARLQVPVQAVASA